MAAAWSCWLYGGMTPEIFLARLQEAISLPTFVVGMIKAPFMALVIGLVACVEGFESRAAPSRSACRPPPRWSSRSSSSSCSTASSPCSSRDRDVSDGQANATPSSACATWSSASASARCSTSVDLDVYRGEILGFVGGSGAGKSVLMRTIIGLLPKRDGTIEVFGQDLAALNGRERRAIERRWGVLFQQGALFSSLTVRRTSNFRCANISTCRSG